MAEYQRVTQTQKIKRFKQFIEETGGWNFKRRNPNDETRPSGDQNPAI